MALFSIKDLSHFDERGLIPGPKEEEKAFQERIKTLEHFFSYPPKEVDHFVNDGEWAPILATLKQSYGIAPDWVVGHYSDKNLTFFQGAALWITEKGDVRIPLIQLRTRFFEGSLLRLYKQSEVLAHEAVHAARMQFDEPLFEEIFAYQTSKNPFRRFFGPLFQAPYEGGIFLFLLFLPLAYEISLFFPIDLSRYAFVRFLPAAYFAFLLTRLLFLRLTLRIALKNIEKQIANPKQKWALALRLTDRELFRFAYSRKKKLTQFLLDQTSFRWRTLKEIYFKKR